MENINIPIRLLKAALICTAKQDVRWYLTGVAIKDGAVSSTDGHRMFTCEIDVPKDYEIIVPRDALTAFLKQVKKEHLDLHAQVIQVKDEVYKLQVVNLKKGELLFVEQLFKPIDGKFPDVKKVIPDPIKRQECMPYYDWKYLVDFQKIAEILGGSNGYFGLIVTGKNTSSVIDFSLTKFDNAIGVVMPKRDYLEQERT